MQVYHVLYNPLAGGGWNDQTKAKLLTALPDCDLRFYDVTALSYPEFFGSIAPEDHLLLVGGDGTLNRFVNDTRDFSFSNSIYYLAAGSGNDFLFDIGESKDKPVLIDSYLKNLPQVTANGKTYRFINGVGYGLDGYCCEEGNRQKQKNKKAINYTAIALKGLFLFFHPTNATVTVDGVQHTFHKVWLAPTMNGRYFGGGMMPTPHQDRKNLEAGLSTLLAWGNRLKILVLFPSIFKGGHLKYKKSCTVLTGHHIRVEFDHPTAMQLDGETIPDVLSYEAVSPLALKNSKPAGVR